MIQRLCVVGLGLIGGSIAQGLRVSRWAENVVGVDADGENLERALQLGLIDSACSGLREGAEEADVVMIATPVGSIGSILAELKPIWSSRAVYTDTGSTKGSVVDAAREVFGQVPANLVPGHPIAGAERSGAEAARGGLFMGKRVILTPLEETATEAAELTADLWSTLGGKVTCMTVEHHDEVLAATSHLPHVLAFVLTEMLGRKDQQQEIFRFAAGGFRDFTRIASSDPRMWLDICLANRWAILPLIEQYRQSLQHAVELIESSDSEALLKLFTDARSARQRFLDQLD